MESTFEDAMQMTSKLTSFYKLFQLAIIWSNNPILGRGLTSVWGEGVGGTDGHILMQIILLPSSTYMFKDEATLLFLHINYS